jgi:hypothetical protein
MDERAILQKIADLEQEVAVLKKALERSGVLYGVKQFLKKAPAKRYLSARQSFLSMLIQFPNPMLLAIGRLFQQRK